VNSIFAAAAMETANRRPSIQDTNDRFLANIQRNGTHSVVPRVAAGEITPDQLIAIGEVVKKYDLYTKITGGQRIDLFGAICHIHHSEASKK
jgi:nitrite reductase (NADH) large subunit